MYSTVVGVSTKVPCGQDEALWYGGIVPHLSPGDNTRAQGRTRFLLKGDAQFIRVCSWVQLAYMYMSEP